MVHRHLAQLHHLAQTEAMTKQDHEKVKLQRCLVAALADQPSGSYSMFQRKSFTQFFREACEYSKNYREYPAFLNFNRKYLARQVTNYSQELMSHYKTALNEALRNQTMQLRKGQTPNKRISVTCFMDHCVLKEMRKKIGCVTIMVRISGPDNETFHTMPLHIFDVTKGVSITDLNGDTVSSSGTTGTANAFNFKEAIEGIFDEDNRKFLGQTFDGAIYDKRKTVFVETLIDYGLDLADILSFTCNTHGSALVINVSIIRCFKDYGLRMDGEDLPEPDSSRKHPDIIWFGNEKEDYRNSFITFNTISKLLASKSKAKKKKMTFCEYCRVLAVQDHQASIAIGDVNPQRTNNLFVKYKNHYFDTDEQERQLPLKMKQENDKKLRRFFDKCQRILDNMPYCKIAMKRKEFEEYFKNIPNASIEVEFEHQLSRWCAIVKYLWSINDSSQKGYDCTLIRSLLIVLKACTEDTDHHAPLSNILIR